VEVEEDIVRFDKYRVLIAEDLSSQIMVACLVQEEFEAQSARCHAIGLQSKGRESARSTSGIRKHAYVFTVIPKTKEK
jgi:hypothetical protein